MVNQIRAQGQLDLLIDSESVQIELADLIITETPRTGWAVASANAATVALDLTLTAELKAMGLAREAIRFIQENRKLAGFEVSDRIKLNAYSGDAQLIQALQLHQAEISEEVLAVEFTFENRSSVATAEEDVLALKIWIERV